MACATAKELEERTTRDRARKFQVCNACRKTHLTNRIVPDTATRMDLLARVHNFDEDDQQLVDLTQRGTSQAINRRQGTAAQNRKK